MPLSEEATYEAVCYLQVVPTYNVFSGKLAGAKVMRMTQTKPMEPLSEARVVKMKLNVPRSMFEDIPLEAVITLPPEEQSQPTVEVTT